MKWNIEKTVQKMATEILHMVSDVDDQNQALINNLLAQQQESLDQLALARIEQQISQDTFDQELAREMRVVEVQLLSQQILAKAHAQTAVNKAIGIYNQAVEKVMDALDIPTL